MGLLLSTAGGDAKTKARNAFIANLVILVLISVYEVYYSSLRLTPLSDTVSKVLLTTITFSSPVLDRIAADEAEAEEGDGDGEISDKYPSELMDFIGLAVLALCFVDMLRSFIVWRRAGSHVATSG